MKGPTSNLGFRERVERLGELAKLVKAASEGTSQVLGKYALDRADSLSAELRQAGVGTGSLTELPAAGRALNRRVALTFDDGFRNVLEFGLEPLADEALANRLEKISMGERLSLAHRASERIARALLLDSETRIVRAALENPRLTEASIIKALMRRNSSAAFVEAVCRHSKWSPRREIRMALLRNEKTPLARALEFSRSLPVTLVRESLHGSRLPTNVKSYVLKDLAKRSGSNGRS